MLCDFRGLMLPTTIGPQITLRLFPNRLLCGADIRLDDLLFGQLPRRFDDRYQAEMIAARALFSGNVQT